MRSHGLRTRELRDLTEELDGPHSDRLLGFRALAVSPSSPAREFNVTLAGFVRGNRANLYAGAQRVAGEVP